MDEKTILRISIDNNNRIKNFLDTTGLEEDDLRMIHSLIDEMRQNIIDELTEIKENSPEEPLSDPNSLF